jgi:hypothetical protein
VLKLSDFKIIEVTERHFSKPHSASLTVRFSLLRIVKGSFATASLFGQANHSLPSIV